MELFPQNKIIVGMVGLPGTGKVPFITSFLLPFRHLLPKKLLGISNGLATKLKFSTFVNHTHKAYLILNRPLQKRFMWRK